MMDISIPTGLQQIQSRLHSIRKTICTKLRTILFNGSHRMKPHETKAWKLSHQIWFITTNDFKYTKQSAVAATKKNKQSV